MIKLYGITWDDPRGYDSLVYISQKYKDLSIQWNKRSLHDFDIGYLTAFLLSDLASFINSTCIVIDGGLISLIPISSRSK